MMCMLLAVCSCDRVPAMLFTRPFCAQRRWISNGEIEIFEPPATREIPQWPRKMFPVGVKNELDSHGQGPGVATASELSPQSLGSENNRLPSALKV